VPDLNNWPAARLLSTAARLVEHAWNEKLADLQLTYAGVTALEILTDAGPMTMAVLAARARVQPQTMGHTVSKLESCGYIVRERSRTDRRSLQASVSDRGRSALGRARDIERTLLEDNDPAAAELAEIMRGIIRRLGSSRWNADLFVPAPGPGTPGTVGTAGPAADPAGNTDKQIP
jgi:DNA-binding MarR family transcriptional regulator